MPRIILCAVAALLPTSVFAVDDVRLEQLKRHTEAEQQRFLGAIQSQISQLQTTLGNFQKLKTPTAREKAQAAEWSKAVANLEKRMEAIKYSGFIFWPEIAPALFRIGQVGQLSSFRGGRAVRVNQIVGPDSMLCERGDDWFFIDGIPTAGRVDDKWYSFETLFDVTGTRKYKTVLGASKTVFVLTPVPQKVIDDLQQWADDEAKFAAKNDKKDALVRAESVKKEADLAKKLAGEEAKVAAQTKAENAAAVLLTFAKNLAKDGKHDLAKKRLRQIIDEYPQTKAAEEAKKLMDTP